MSTKVCKLAHCDEKHHCKGYCHLHYKRSRTGIDLYKPKQIKDPGRGCSVEGCEKTHKSQGMCSLHRSRVVQGVPLQQKVQEKDGAQGCLFGKCGNKHHSHGYCRVHWERVNKARRKRKMVSDFGDKCHDCRNSFPDYVFDFDNISEKPGHIRISTLLDKNANILLIEKELERCEMVCANCHRIRTNCRYDGKEELDKHARNS